MSKWTSSLKLLLLAAGLVTFASGCAEERAPINRIQPNAMKKAFFIGDKLQDGSDDPEFYTAQTVVDVPYGTDQAVGAFTGLVGDLKRVKWEITENAINARLSYEEIEGVDGHGSRTTDNGKVVASYKISSHFDIKRSYNPQTGEELNVVEENTTDRPWYEREYFRVDWSQNLISATLWDPLAQNTLFGTPVEAQPLAYYVSDPNSPDAPLFDAKDGYFDFVNKYYLSPRKMNVDGQDIDACFYYSSVVIGGSFPFGNCESSEVSVRASFRRIAQPGEAGYTDYEPVEWDGSREYAFSAFTVSRLGWDNHYGIVDDQWRRFAVRHNIWNASHAKDAAGKYITCADPTEVANGVDPTHDDDKNGTDDECEGAGAGSHCDALTGQCTIPFAKRTVKPVVWHYSVDPGDTTYLESTRFASWEWDTAMRIAVQAARRVECDRTSGASIAGTKWDGQACADAFPITQTDDAEVSEVRDVMHCWELNGRNSPDCTPQNPFSIAAMDPVVILCQNPVAKTDDPHCGKPGTTVRPGDIRYHHVNMWPTRQSSSPWGYGPSLGDPLTGEIVSVGINVYASVTDTTAQSFEDTMAWINGELPTSQITSGSYVRDWVRSNQSAENTPAFWPAMSRDETDRRVQSIVGMNPQLIQQGVAQVPLQGLQDLDRALYFTRVPSDASAVNLNANADARMAMLKGTPIESQLMNPMWLELAGIDPSSTVDDKTLEMASPLRNMHPDSILKRERDLDNALARHGQCMLAAPEPTGLPAFAKVIRQKFPPQNYGNDTVGQERRNSDIWNYLRYKLNYSVILHEMGHTFGERHNFVGSYDKFNYRPQYWQLRTKSGSVTAKCTGDPTENPESCIGPRYFDPLTQEEIDGSIFTWQHTTVMDYPGDSTQDTLGLGVYDYAAVRMFYGDVVDVRDDKMFPAAQFDLKSGTDVRGTGTLEGEAIRGMVDYAGGVFGQVVFLNDANNTFVHHTEYQNRFKMLWNCQPVTPTQPGWWDESKWGTWDPVFDGHIVRNEVCDRAPVEYHAYNDLVPDRLNIYLDPKAYIVRRTRLPDGRVRVPYGCENDDWADGGSPPAYRHDNGADMYEEMVFHSSLYENRHIFDNFRNGKTTFTVYGAYSRALSRYHSKIASLTNGYAFAVDFYLRKFADDYGYPFSLVMSGNAGPGSFLYDHTVAASVALDHFTRVMTRPQEGLYYKRNPTDPLIYSTKDSFNNPPPALQQVVTLPNGTYVGDDGSLGLGARPLQNEFNYTNGAWTSYYMNQAGDYYEKVLAPQLMFEAGLGGYATYRFDALDLRPTFVNVTSLWPEGIREMVGVMLTEDYELIAPRLSTTNGVPDTTDPSNPANAYPTKPLGWVSWVAGSGPRVCWNLGSRLSCTDALGGPIVQNPTVSGSIGIEPNWGYEQQKFLLMWLYVYQPDSEVADWVDMMRIYKLPVSSPAPGYQPDQRVEFFDPESGTRYFARRYGDETILGHTYDKGIGAKMIQWANILAGRAYVLDPTTPYDPASGAAKYVLNADGTPKVQADQYLPPDDPNNVRCDENPACTQLRRYRGLLDFARDAAGYAGFPEPALQIAGSN